MKLLGLLLCTALCYYAAAGTVPEGCEDKEHNNNIVLACITPLAAYNSVADLKADKNDACTIEKEIQECVKSKGGLCKDQGRELYGIVGLFEDACEHHEDEETMWALASALESITPETEQQMEHDFSACLEEAALDFFDFAKLLFNEHEEESDFELDPSKVVQCTYICGVSAVAKSFNLSPINLERLVKAVLHEAGMELADVEICQSKLALPTSLCASVDKCHKDDDHNDEIALKCFDSFDRHIEDYSIFKGKEKSEEVYSTIQTCIHENGDFCHDQSLLGPALLAIFKYVSEHVEDGNIWWDLLNKVEHVTDEDENKFETSFVSCLNESNHQYLSPSHLSVASFNNMDNLNKYLEGIYVCVVASIADTFHSDYAATGRLCNEFVGKLGFAVDKVDFCGHHLTLPTALCAA